MDPPLKKRCGFEGCNKKLSLVDYACKCKATYCGAHRVPETHACTFDFKEDHKKNLLVYMQDAVTSKKMEVL